MPALTRPLLRPFADLRLPATPEDWRVLSALSLYRLFLVALLLALYQSGQSTLFFADIRPRGFYLACLGYALAALVLLPPLLYRVPRMSVQAHMHFFTDLAATMGLVYTSGGVPGGLGILLLTPAVGCSLVLSPRMATMQAAAATLAVFAEEILRQYPSRFEASDFTQAGVLGLVFFATNMAANAVGQRARRSELLAERVGSDLASLSRLSENIVEFMQSGVMVIDDGRIRLLNAAARQLLHLPPTALGAPLEETAPAIARAHAAWQANPTREPVPVFDAGSEVIPRFTRLGYQRSAPVLCLVERADELRAQAQQLKLAALGRLYAGIAHEIRNPLAAISHAGQLLTESEGLAEEDRRLLDMIQRHSQRIDKIVRDVLRLSRREGGTPDSIRLRPWLTQAIAQYQEAHGHDPRPIDLLELPEDLQVRFDPHHLQQVLGNLWDNSFEHGLREGRTVRVELRGGRGVAAIPFLEVRDNGPGIPPSMRDRIFEPFFTTAPQGTGLGLYLARELCDYNQAHLSYVPQLTGACFRLTFTPAETKA